MRKSKTKFKKGVASFYIVAFSTLILVIIATSFTTVVLSEMARAENDELSQSAYDAALAGVEDAKVAYTNYQKCQEGGTSASGVSCAEIEALMRAPECGMVAKILGRNTNGAEVLVEEKSDFIGGVANNMLQAYTCVKINSKLDSYTSTLTEDDYIRVVRVQLADGVKANDIERVKVSWYSTKDYSSVKGANYSFSNVSGDKVLFPKAKGESVAMPPMISVGLVQTGENFRLTDFESVNDGTDRGTVFLVPTEKYGVATRSQSAAHSNDTQGNYIGTCIGKSDRDCRDNGGTITAGQIIKTNDRTVKNLPFAVLCSDGRNSGGDFACSTWLELPKPVGGVARSDDTFMFAVSLVYGQPNTSFSLEFYCRGGSNCGRGAAAGGVSDKASLEGMQIEIDSTGRANNLYRRVLSRLEPTDTYFPFPLYGIELLEDGGDGLLSKPRVVTCEYNFDWTC